MYSASGTPAVVGVNAGDAVTGICIAGVDIAAVVGLHPAVGDGLLQGDAPDGGHIGVDRAAVAVISGLYLPAVHGQGDIAEGEAVGVDAADLQAGEVMGSLGGGEAVADIGTGDKPSDAGAVFGPGHELGRAALNHVLAGGALHCLDPGHGGRHRCGSGHRCGHRSGHGCRRGSCRHRSHGHSRCCGAVGGSAAGSGGHIGREAAFHHRSCHRQRSCSGMRRNCGDGGGHRLIQLVRFFIPSAGPEAHTEDGKHDIYKHSFHGRFSNALFA